MTDQQTKDEGVLSGGSFDRRYMRKGKHSVLLPLPEAYHASIGLTIAYWGYFETIFDVCLEGLIAGESADGGTRDTSGDWKRKSFRIRRQLFRDICGEWLAKAEPEAAAKLTGVLDCALQLHRKRNLIAHGLYGYSIPPHSSIAQHCYAVNHGSGEKFQFDEDVLKKLYHDISHLAADLILTFKTIGDWEGALMLIPDEEILRVYRETVHRWNPNPKRRPPSP